jgi:hypothetical protein
MIEPVKRVRRHLREVSSLIRRRIHREKILNHRLIFSINSGRSGSAYLAHLLGTARHVTSFHEPRPEMIGRYLDMVTRQPYDRTIAKRRVKSVAIQDILIGLPVSQVYCETNNMFIKTFFDVVLQDFRHENLAVITLRRRLAHVLKSLVECDFSPRAAERISSRPPGGLWFSSPNAVTAAIRCIGADHELDQYDLCIGYLIDIEARAVRFQRAYPWIRNIALRVEALGDFDNVERLFQQLGIEPTNATRDAYRERVNLKEGVKQRANRAVDLAYCERRIEQYLQKAASLGIEVPNTMAID